MSVVHQNKWYVEPVPEEETEGWLLTYLDLITLLLVLLVVMLALSGKVAKMLPIPTTSGLLPAHSGLLPGGNVSDVPGAIPLPAASVSDGSQVIPLSGAPLPNTPVLGAPAVVSLIPAPADAIRLPAIVASTEWDSPTYAPGLVDPDHHKTSLFVDLPSHFQTGTDPDAVLRHVMGHDRGAPVAIAELVAAEPAADDVSLLPLPELGDDIEIIRKPESINLRINSEILYTSAKADLSLEGLAVLHKLVPVLKDSEYIITVEGHTDALPIRGGQYPSNWELSSARAGRVVRYLAANGIDSTRLRAIGYADTRPLTNNNTEQGRASNRRVEIMLEPPTRVDSP